MLSSNSPSQLIISGKPSARSPSAATIRTAASTPSPIPLISTASACSPLATRASPATAPSPRPSSACSEKELSSLQHVSARPFPVAAVRYGRARHERLSGVLSTFPARRRPPSSPPPLGPTSSARSCWSSSARNRSSLCSCAGRHGMRNCGGTCFCALPQVRFAARKEVPACRSPPTWIFNRTGR